MKVLLLLAFAAVCGLASCRPQEEKYTTKYDNVDLDAILKNDRLLRNYIDCVMGKKSCTKDGEELKRVLPDAIKTGCSKCNETQRNGAKKVARYLIKNKPEWWAELEKTFDPDGTYRKKYEAEIKSEGF
ncbi:ejaculatory bulb-specific protein 3-like [Cylas formicarius]|nr:ejaculatory bulb-specific protein 3-like [Cylas formicarius]